jgi:hypothetical protein
MTTSTGLTTGVTSGPIAAMYARTAEIFAKTFAMEITKRHAASAVIFARTGVIYAKTGVTCVRTAATSVMTDATFVTISKDKSELAWEGRTAAAIFAAAVFLLRLSRDRESDQQSAHRIFDPLQIFFAASFD